MEPERWGGSDRIIVKAAGLDVVQKQEMLWQLAPGKGRRHIGQEVSRVASFLGTPNWELLIEPYYGRNSFCGRESGSVVRTEFAVACDVDTPSQGEMLAFT